MRHKCLIFILVLIQLMPLNSGQPLSTNSSLENFVEFYENELYLIAEDFCEKAKNLSENLLQNEDIKEASLNEIKEFKIFLQEFLQDYAHFKRYKLYQPLLHILIDAVKVKVQNSQQNIKFKQTMKQYFADILKDYEENYKKFIREKFLAKIEDLKKELSPEDLKQILKLSELVDRLRTCEDYKCFPIFTEPVYTALNVPNNLVIKYSKIEFKKFTTLLSIRMYNVGNLILNNEQFSLLSLETKQNITHDIKDFQKKFENNNDIEKFVTIINENPKFPKKNYNKTNFPSEDRVILNDMLSKLETQLAKTKYELENLNVMQMLSFKMSFILRLEPQSNLEDIKPLLEYLKNTI